MQTTLPAPALPVQALHTHPVPHRQRFAHLPITYALGLHCAPAPSWRRGCVDAARACPQRRMRAPPSPRSRCNLNGSRRGRLPSRPSGAARICPTASRAPVRSRPLWHGGAPPRWRGRAGCRRTWRQRKTGQRERRIARRTRGSGGRGQRGTGERDGASAHYAHRVHDERLRGELGANLDAAYTNRVRYGKKELAVACESEHREGRQHPVPWPRLGRP